MTKVSILGSTGSIGRNALDVIERLGPDYRVVGLAAGRNIELLREQVKKYQPSIVSVERAEDIPYAADSIRKPGIRFVHGQEGASEVAAFEENDVVISAITGISGLQPTMAAVKAGKRVALANKESMVAAGSLIRKAAAQSGAAILPVDSEHSGIFQCLNKEREEDVKRVILTASGGPFLCMPREEWGNIALEDALNHPRWEMGVKVTIDSATLMNKGLELIEARWLFNLPPAKLDVLIHPQSVVHALVELNDGSILAQLSQADMRIPIQYALTFPCRSSGASPSLDLGRLGELQFSRVKKGQFPLFDLAMTALFEGDSLPVVLNAANEIAVDAFLEKRIKFVDIAEIVCSVLDGHEKRAVSSMEETLEIDRATRIDTRNLLKHRY